MESIHFHKVGKMRDPHVEAIYFSVGSSEDISYENPDPLEFCNHLGAFILKEGVLKVIPAEHFRSGADANMALEGFLRSWEIEADIKRNVGMIRFSYTRADVIDRDPPPIGEPQFIHAEGFATVTVSCSASLHLVASRYPEPPERFSATEYAQHAYRRWMNFHTGREPLQAMAYFVLTLFQKPIGTRADACRHFMVDRDVLNRIGELCSNRGDIMTARKVDSLTFQELSDIEKKWLETAVKRLIHRMGEQASGYPVELITMGSIGQF